jgi:cellulose biosynthesis protein BcsQ
MRTKKCLTVSSWKGGTGKTTLVILLAETLARRNERVLIIDLESNCAVTQCYNVIDQALEDEKKTSMGFLMGNGSDFPADGIIPVKENIDILPSHLQNVLLGNIMDNRLKLNIRRAGLLDKYDYIIIDPPGFWGAHTKNAVTAADTIVIPGMGSRLDFEATNLYFNTLAQCDLPADVNVCLNAFNREYNLPGILEKYQERFGVYLTPSVPYINTLKKLADNTDYIIHPTVRKRLDAFVDWITDPEEADAKNNVVNFG